MQIMVSSCLLGKKTKYNGESNRQDTLIDFLKDYEVIPICPEVLGGLPIPRKSAERIANRVVTCDNDDVTENFLNGALKTLEIAQKKNIKFAILKKNSPSCGYGKIYDGTFSHQLITGNGMTADLLAKEGIIILNEDNYQEYFKKV